MNLLIIFLGAAYMFSILIAVPFFGLSIWIVHRDEPASMPFLIALLFAYCALGYLLIKIGPGYLRKRLLDKIAPYKEKGFAPQCEQQSNTYDRYLGFDPKAGKVLYVDVRTGTELIDFDSISGWEIETERGRPTLLKVFTRVPSRPVLNVSIPRHDNGDAWKGRFMTMFG